MKSLSKEKWLGSPESVPYAPGYGFILAIFAICLIGLIIGGFLFWYVPTVGFKNIHPSLPYITGAIFFLAASFVITVAGVFTFALIKGKGFLPSPRYRWALVKFFLPMMFFAGGLLKIPRIKIEEAFLDLNNRMVKAILTGGRRFSPEKILILMPHCVQWEGCKIKVTKDVRNCTGCGRCEIKELVGVSDEYKINLFVLTGGSVARRRLYEYSPDVVIAVACERDLTSGVQDAYPLPVMTIVNKRPRGYCVETGVEIEDIKGAIRTLVAAGTA